MSRIRTGTGRIPLEALLGISEERPAPQAIPEAQIARLQEAFALHQQPNPFNPGDIVMLGACVLSHEEAATRPMLVLETQPDGGRALDDRDRVNVRLLMVDDDGDLTMQWAEHWQLEPYHAAGK